MSIYPTSPTNWQVHIKGWIRYKYYSADKTWRREEDPNLLAENIKDWVTIHEVEWTLTPWASFPTAEVSLTTTILWRTVYYRIYGNIIFLGWVHIPNPTWHIGNTAYTADYIATHLWKTMKSYLYSPHVNLDKTYQILNSFQTNNVDAWYENNAVWGRHLIAIEVY